MWEVVTDFYKKIFLFNLLIKSSCRKHCIASVTTSSILAVCSGTVVYDVHKHITNVPRLSKSLVNNNKLRGYGWVHNLNSNVIIHCHFNPTIYKYYSVSTINHAKMQLRHPCKFKLAKAVIVIKQFQIILYLKKKKRIIFQFTNECHLSWIKMKHSKFIEEWSTNVNLPSLCIVIIIMNTDIAGLSNSIANDYQLYLTYIHKSINFLSVSRQIFMATYSFWVISGFKVMWRNIDQLIDLRVMQNEMM